MRTKKKVARRSVQSEARKTDLLGALFTSTQQKVLSLFFGQPERQFSLKEIISLASSGSGAVQREVEKLSAVELLSTVTSGRAKLYRANQQSPLFEEMKSIFLKTSGVPQLIKIALLGTQAKIEQAFIYGSLAKKTDAAMSDVDLFVVSDDLSLASLYEAMVPIEALIGRKISSTLYKSTELAEKLKSKNPFIVKINKGERINLLGNPDGI